MCIRKYLGVIAYSSICVFLSVCNVRLGMSAHQRASPSISVSLRILRIVCYVYACVHVHVYMSYHSISR